MIHTPSSIGSAIAANGGAVIRRQHPPSPLKLIMEYFDNKHKKNLHNKPISPATKPNPDTKTNPPKQQPQPDNASVVPIVVVNPNFNSTNEIGAVAVDESRRHHKRSHNDKKRRQDDRRDDSGRKHGHHSHYRRHQGNCGTSSSGRRGHRIEGVGIAELPDFVLVHVFGFLTARDCSVARLVSHRWNQIARQDPVWQQIVLLQYSYCANWGMVSNIEGTYCDWISFYKSVVEVSLNVCHACFGLAALSQPREVLLHPTDTLHHVFHLFKTAFIDDALLQECALTDGNLHMHISRCPPYDLLVQPATPSPCPCPSPSPCCSCPSPSPSFVPPHAPSPSGPSSYSHLHSHSNINGSTQGGLMLLAELTRPATPSPCLIRDQPFASCPVFSTPCTKHFVQSGQQLRGNCLVSDMGLIQGDTIELFICHS
ncbi:hypothetical protein Pelo_7011 [Pelomyxa schiedti]|nr:hypothetical protein Pelo_7011 [Pelomyxa schiedti]